MKKNNFLKNALLALTGLVPCALIPCSASAQLPIIIAATSELNFGTVAADGAAGGTVVISTAGARTRSGAVVLVGGAGLESAGVISVSGSTGVNITLSMTSTFFNVSNTTGAIMRVDTFNIANPAGGAVEVVTLPASPSTFPIGATLNVNAGQAPGTYLGDFIISAIYQ